MIDRPGVLVTAVVARTLAVPLAAAAGAGLSGAGRDMLARVAFPSSLAPSPSPHVTEAPCSSPFFTSIALLPPCRALV